MFLPPHEFLNWVAGRLVYVYNENPNVDYVLELRRIAKTLEPKKRGRKPNQRREENAA